MKSINLKLVYILGLLFLSLFAGCRKDDDEPTPEELQTKKLSGIWSVGTEGSVMRNGALLNEWNNFTLTISQGSYSTTTTDETVWPLSGTWRFYENDLTRIERNDGVILDIHLSESILIISFTIPAGDSGGRLKGIDGEYSFTLIKQ